MARVVPTTATAATAATTGGSSLPAVRGTAAAAGVAPLAATTSAARESALVRARGADMADMKAVLAQSNRALTFLRAQPMLGPGAPVRLVRDIGGGGGSGGGIGGSAAETLLASDTAAVSTSRRTRGSSARGRDCGGGDTDGDHGGALPEVSSPRDGAGGESEATHGAATARSRSRRGSYTSRRRSLGGPNRGTRLDVAISAVLSGPEGAALAAATRNSSRVTQLLARDGAEPPMPLYDFDGRVTLYAAPVAPAVAEARRLRRPLSAFRTSRGVASEDVAVPDIVPVAYPDLRDSTAAAAAEARDGAQQAAMRAYEASVAAAAAAVPPLTHAAAVNAMVLDAASGGKPVSKGDRAVLGAAITSLHTGTIPGSTAASGSAAAAGPAAAAAAAAGGDGASRMALRQSSQAVVISESGVATAEAHRRIQAAHDVSIKAAAATRRSAEAGVVGAPLVVRPLIETPPAKPPLDVRAATKLVAEVGAVAAMVAHGRPLATALRPALELVRHATPTRPGSPSFHSEPLAAATGSPAAAGVVPTPTISAYPSVRSAGGGGGESTGRSAGDEEAGGGVAGSEGGGGGGGGTTARDATHRRGSVRPSGGAGRDAWLFADRTDPHAVVEAAMLPSGKLQVGSLVYTQEQAATLLAVHAASPALATAYAAVVGAINEQHAGVRASRRAFSASASASQRAMREHVHRHLYQQQVERTVKSAAVEASVTHAVRHAPMFGTDVPAGAALWSPATQRYTPAGAGVTSAHLASPMRPASARGGAVPPPHSATGKDAAHRATRPATAGGRLAVPVPATPASMGSGGVVGTPRSTGAPAPAPAAAASAAAPAAASTLATPVPLPKVAGDGASKSARLPGVLWFATTTAPDGTQVPLNAGVRAAATQALNAFSSTTMPPTAADARTAAYAARMAAIDSATSLHSHAAADAQCGIEEDKDSDDGGGSSADEFDGFGGRTRRRQALRSRHRDASPSPAARARLAAAVRMELADLGVHAGGVEETAAAVRLHAQRQRLAVARQMCQQQRAVLEAVMAGRVRGLTSIDTVFLHAMRAVYRHGILLDADTVLPFLDGVHTRVSAIAMDDLPLDMKREAEIDKAAAASAAAHVASLFSFGHPPAAAAGGAGTGRSDSLSARRSSLRHALLQHARRLSTAATAAGMAADAAHATELLEHRPHADSVPPLIAREVPRPPVAATLRWAPDARPLRATPRLLTDRTAATAHEPTATPRQPAARPGSAPARATRRSSVHGVGTGGGGGGGGGGGAAGGAHADAHHVAAQFMNREERAARRCRAEWPVRLAAPVAALLTATGLSTDAYHAWLAARDLVLPTPAAVTEAVDREKREVATVNAAAARTSARGASSSSAAARRHARRQTLHARTTVLWDALRGALHAGHIVRADL